MCPSLVEIRSDTSEIRVEKRRNKIKRKKVRKKVKKQEKTTAVKYALRHRDAVRANEDDNSRPNDNNSSSSSSSSGSIYSPVFSKRQRITLRLLYAIGRPSVVCLSVCRLSVVCDVGAAYSGG